VLRLILDEWQRQTQEAAFDKIGRAGNLLLVSRERIPLGSILSGAIVALGTKSIVSTPDDLLFAIQFVDRLALKLILVILIDRLCRFD